jgi:hypothetical protein
VETVNQEKHWTAESVENFTYRIAADFLAQVENKMEQDGVSRSDVAERLGRTAGRVTQLFNPGNMTLGTAVRLGSVVGMKVSIIGYEDTDPNNSEGPVNSGIFYQCWKNQGSPKTFFDLSNEAPFVGGTYVVNNVNCGIGAHFTNCATPGLLNGNVLDLTNTNSYVNGSNTIHVNTIHIITSIEPFDHKQIRPVWSQLQRVSSIATSIYTDPIVQHQVSTATVH